MIDFITRLYKNEDEALVYNSFLKSFHNNYPIKLVPPTIYFRAQSEEINFLIRNATILVACYPEDANEIMGYVIYSIVEDTLVIHYVYVKSVVRNKYIATNLLKEVIKDRKMIIFTHMFDSFSKVKYKLKDVKMVYDQYLLTSLRLHEGKSGNI